MTVAYDIARATPEAVRALPVHNDRLMPFLLEIESAVEQLCVRIFTTPLPAFTKRVLVLATTTTTYAAFEAALCELVGVDGPQMAVEAWRSLAYYSALV